LIRCGHLINFKPAQKGRNILKNNIFLIKNDSNRENFILGTKKINLISTKGDNSIIRKE
jgi:hypothetical protein